MSCPAGNYKAMRQRSTCHLPLGSWQLPLDDLRLELLLLMAAVANSNLRLHLRFVHSPRAFLRMRLWLWLRLPFEHAANCFFGCPCSCHNLPAPPTCHTCHSALSCLAVIFSRSGGALCGSCWQRLLDPAGPALARIGKGKPATRGIEPEARRGGVSSPTHSH